MTSRPGRLRIRPGNLTFLVVAGLLASGCLQGAPEAQATVPIPSLVDASLASGDQRVWGTTPLFWEGRDIRAPSRGGYLSWFLPSDPEPACNKISERCDLFDFDLALPAGFWDTHNGFLEVSVTNLPGDYPDGWFDMIVRDGTGKKVGTTAYGKYSIFVEIRDAPPGPYQVAVSAYSGPIDYDGVVQLEATPREPPASGPKRDLLPDLVMMHPLDLKVDLRSWDNWGGGNEVNPAVRAAMAAAGIVGCAPDEVTDEAARRCLRVSTAVANIGEGPLIIVLPAAESPHLVRGAGHYYQRILQSDQTTRDVPSSREAFFHASHAHLHYPKLVRLQVFQHDLETGMRGSEVGRGSKTGFCLADEGLFRHGDLGTSRPRWDLAEGNCIAPFNRFDEGPKEWSMGIWPQWFDMYETYRTGQYAEISGVPDGVYEFVVTVDPDGTIRESDKTNNENRAVFRLAGNTVTILDPPPRRALPG